MGILSIKVGIGRAGGMRGLLRTRMGWLLGEARGIVSGVWGGRG